jgi:hypothetical protein
MRALPLLLLPLLAPLGCHPDATPVASQASADALHLGVPVLNLLAPAPVQRVLSDDQRSTLKALDAQARDDLATRAEQADAAAANLQTRLIAMVRAGGAAPAADVTGGVVEADAGLRTATFGVMARGLDTLGAQGRAALFGADAMPSPADLLEPMQPLVDTETVPLRQVLGEAGVSGTPAILPLIDRDTRRLDAVSTALVQEHDQAEALDPSAADLGAQMTGVGKTLEAAVEKSARERTSIATSLLQAVPVDEAAKLLTDPLFADYAGLRLAGHSRVQSLTGPTGDPGGGPGPNGPGRPAPAGADDGQPAPGDAPR